MKEDNVDETTDADLKKKIAEITTTMDKQTLTIWASDCAKHVLSYFEEKHPNDDRPRKAVEAARAWVSGEISVDETRSAAFAAHAAAREVEDDKACAVARAAGHAAATAHVAGHAIHAANYAVKTNSKERIWQYERLLELSDNMTE